MERDLEGDRDTNFRTILGFPDLYDELGEIR